MQTSWKKQTREALIKLPKKIKKKEKKRNTHFLLCTIACFSVVNSTLKKKKGRDVTSQAKLNEKPTAKKRKGRLTVDVN